ncbi:MAG: peptide chain release factor N(5)-glutamine methyltransferase [Opitutaceae bacterium]|nr:peptide chain release factor N(5)-glutamine methyltransferase [Opitutaceae bacterium]
MLTLLDIVKRTTDFFAKHGIESARLNAELVIAHALGMNRMKIYLQFERPLTEKELESIRPLVKRRAQREPLAYVLGTAPFGDLTLRVDRRVLVPRPETEQLVEIVKDAFAATPPVRILDLGTGSGALALGLARAFPAARVVAVDASADALALAQDNAAACGLAGQVEFRASDWFAAIRADERFDLIISNPPYLTEAEWAEAQPEVRDHEPKPALVAADAGCADLLKIIAAAPRHLAPGGSLFLETGIDQHPRLLEAIADAGLIEGRSIQDWSERPRFVAAMLPR